MALQLTSLRHLPGKVRSTLNAFLWQQQVAELPLWQRFLVRGSQIFVAVMRDLFGGQLSLRAMSLVYTTVLGFFPLLALAFTVLRSLGAHNALEPALLALLQPLGEGRTELTADILGYVDNMRLDLIGITSVGLLLFFALDMMRKIESSFNYIWAVKRGRSWSSRVSEYLFAVIVSPLLLFLSISITSYVNTNFFERFLENLIYGSVIIEMTALLAPILLMSLGFAFAYGFLPNTRIQFSSAFIGGFITTIIWKLMGSVFQGYLVAAARESVYLAFAAAIAIMIFIYFGWLMALVGSSIAFYHQNPAKTRTGRKEPVLSIHQQEQLCLAVAAAVIRHFSQGDAPVSEAQLSEELNISPLAVEHSLETLAAIHLISRTNETPPRILPTRSVSDCTLVDIWRVLRNTNADEFSDHAESPDLARIRHFQDDLDAAVDRALGTRRFTDMPTESETESTLEDPVKAVNKRLD